MFMNHFRGDSALLALIGWNSPDGRSAATERLTGQPVAKYFIRVSYNRIRLYSKEKNFSNSPVACRSSITLW
jgi:hypothetical protein